MEENERKRKKTFAIVFLSVFALILAIDLIFFVDWDKKEKPNQSGEVQTEETGKTEGKNTAEEDGTSTAGEKKKTGDPLSMTKEAITYLYREHITPVGDGEEYPKEQSGPLKKELLNMAQDSDYMGILEKMNSLLDRYSFSEGPNLDIAGIYHDVILMKDLKDEEDKIKFGNTVATSKTPEMLVANTLFSDNFARRQILEDWTSIAPIGYDHFVMSQPRMFRTPEEAADEPLFKNRNVVEEIFVMHDQLNTVYAFDITIPQLDNGLPITAYVWEDLFGKIGFYGMYVPDDFKTYEQPLEWWAEQDYLYDIAEEEREKYYKDLEEKGKITEEQIEQWFDSGY